MGSSKPSTGGSVRRRWFRLEFLLVIILLYHVVFQIFMSSSSFGTDNTDSYLDLGKPMEQASNSTIVKQKSLSKDQIRKRKIRTKIREQKELLREQKELLESLISKGNTLKEEQLHEISEQKKLLSALRSKADEIAAKINKLKPLIQENQEVIHDSEQGDLVEQDPLEAQRTKVGAPEVAAQANQPAEKQLDDTIPQKEEPQTVEVSRTSKLVWSIASRKASLDLEETPINLSSPACLPFLYNQTKDGNLDNSDYYDEFWNENTAKRPTKIKFLHMRKAGGTTLAKYFKKVVRSNKTSFREFESCEGSRDCLDLDDHEDGYRKFHTNLNGTKGWDDSGSTLYVTHLREPIARAMSNYKYSKRFKCRDAFADDFVKPEPEDLLMTLEEFVSKVDLGKDGKFNPTQHWLWNCNSNCYARWVTGLYNPTTLTTTRYINPIKPSFVTEFTNSYPTMSKFYYNDREEPTDFGWLLSLDALTLLLRYDLIIVLEWLENDPEYARLVEDVFFGGVRGIRTKHYAHCSKSMKKMNELVPLEIKNSTLERLHEMNDIDAKLYRMMTSCER